MTAVIVLKTKMPIPIRRLVTWLNTLKLTTDQVHRLSEAINDIVEVIDEIPDRWVTEEWHDFGFPE